MSDNWQARAWQLQEAIESDYFQHSEWCGVSAVDGKSCACGFLQYRALLAVEPQENTMTVNWRARALAAQTEAKHLKVVIDSNNWPSTAAELLHDAETEVQIQRERVERAEAEAGRLRALLAQAVEACQLGHDPACPCENRPVGFDECTCWCLPLYAAAGATTLTIPATTPAQDQTDQRVAALVAAAREYAAARGVADQVTNLADNDPRQQRVYHAVGELLDAALALAAEGEAAGDTEGGAT